jgi:hypothetical protein
LGGDAIHAKEEGVAVLDVHLNYVIRLFLNAASLMCGLLLMPHIRCVAAITEDDIEDSDMITWSLTGNQYYLP